MIDGGGPSANGDSSSANSYGGDVVVVQMILATMVLLDLIIK